MLSGRPRHHGVSLVEWMTVLSVSSIVLMLALPAMGNWLRDIEVRSSAGTLMAALQSARAEAIARNADVRLQLVDKLGRPGWKVSCVNASASCPGELRGQPPATATGARWGASMSPALPPLDTAIAAGEGLPAGITFDPLGSAPAVAAGTDPARIDITNANDASARRLVILIAAHGRVHLCDPLAATGRPERCQ